MAYKFGSDEPVRRAIVRCSGEQLDRAILELSERVDTDPVGAVHNARKAIKKERSLLRLARGAMSDKQRQCANAALRQVARRLSDARDADVMIAATAQLSEQFAGQLPARAFEAVGAHLEARRSAEPARGNGPVVGADALEELAGVRGSLDWRLRPGGWKALRSGLVRSYRRGRDAFGVAQPSGETADLHAWRKRVKDLWYHERLLAPTCGPTVRAHAKELGRLADLLGEDHDLAVLRDALAQDLVPAAADLEAMLNLIDHRRAELQSQAAHVGERVYAEKPKAFERRMRSSWKAGRALARAPEKQRPALLGATTR